MKDPLEFKNGKPVFPMSVTDMSANKTGSWRYMRPLYEEKTAPCIKGCPAGEKIPLYFALVKEKRYEEAWHVILQDNPLPGVCGRVCYHPCETVCNRRFFDQTIAINNMERFVADQNLNNKFPGHFYATPSGKKIAIIGSGPAGLSAAFQLARKGHKVTIYEALPRPGGMLQMGIPEYRLPRFVLEKEINDIKSMGVTILTSKQIGKDIPLQELENEYDAILIATGATKSRPIGVPGANKKGVHSGLQFLKDFNLNNKKNIGKRLVVVGGGNTAIDCARSAVRIGAKVTIVYRRSRQEMPAVAEEIEEAENEGVKINYLCNPVEFSGNGKIEKIKLQRMKLGMADQDGRRRPIPVEGSEYEMEADQVMLAIGEVPDLEFISKGLQEKWGRININTFQMTSQKGIFACGDAADGPVGTVVDAIATGKRSAMAIDSYLNAKEFKDPQHNQIVNYSDLNLDYFYHEIRPRQQRNDLSEINDNFEEVNRGIREEDALNEANRCFSCGTCTYCDTCLVYCPDVAISKSADGKGYIIDYDYCKGCGICVHECPRHAMSFKEEIKWQTV
jgi:putative selenate reductase YgfK subunit